jgi:hypothetical protein
LAANACTKDPTPVLKLDFGPDLDPKQVWSEEKENYLGPFKNKS